MGAKGFYGVTGRHKLDSTDDASFVVQNTSNGCERLRVRSFRVFTGTSTSTTVLVQKVAYSPFTLNVYPKILAFCSFLLIIHCTYSSHG